MEKIVELTMSRLFQLAEYVLSKCDHSGAHHTMGESYGEHKRYDFFVKNLLGVNPPKWSELR